MDDGYGFFQVAWMWCRCANGHQILAGHGLDRDGLPVSPPPTTCTTCGLLLECTETDPGS